MKKKALGSVARGLDFRFVDERVLFCLVDPKHVMETPD